MENKSARLEWELKKCLRAMEEEARRDIPKRVALLRMLSPDTSSTRRSASTSPSENEPPPK
jgi:hypothetical protein